MSPACTHSSRRASYFGDHRVLGVAVSGARGRVQPLAEGWPRTRASVSVGLHHHNSWIADVNPRKHLPRLPLSAVFSGQLSDGEVGGEDGAECLQAALHTPAQLGFPPPHVLLLAGIRSQFGSLRTAIASSCFNRSLLLTYVTLNRPLVCGFQCPHLWEEGYGLDQDLCKSSQLKWLMVWCMLSGQEWILVHHLQILSLDRC